MEKRMISRKYGRIRRRRRRWRAGGLLLCLAVVVTVWVGFFRGAALKSAPFRRLIDHAPPVFATENAPPESRLDDVSDDPEWYLTLVNRWTPIPEGYEVDLVEVEGGELVDARIYEPLMTMLEAAREGNQGQLPLVVSGYRTQEHQQQLYDDKIAKYRGQGYSASEAKEMAERLVAVPGYSEHQLGFAVDINGATYDVYLWLQENSCKYGFIFRYPGDKSEITGTSEEVWHYRYVGVEAATEMHERGLCLEEYLEACGGEL